MAGENKNYQTENKTKSIEQLKKTISEVRYGTVSAVIQDGKIVQIEKNEKIRLV